MAYGEQMTSHELNHVNQLVRVFGQPLKEERTPYVSLLDVEHHRRVLLDPE